MARWPTPTAPEATSGRVMSKACGEQRTQGDLHGEEEALALVAQAVGVRHDDVLERHCAGVGSAAVSKRSEVSRRKSEQEWGSHVRASVRVSKGEQDIRSEQEKE
jgi:hypothetical protein